MIEFGKALEDFDKSLVTSQRGFKRGWEGLRRAELFFDRATKIREHILQETLNEKGLAVCSGIHYSDKQDKKIKDPSPQQLGIFPKEQMRLLFYQRGPYDIQGEYEDSTGETIRLELLCPEHFPKNREWHMYENGGYTHIESEVVIKEGKYISVVNGADITDLASQRGYDMEPNGKRPFLLEATVFRHFGIPDLPAKPDYNSVQP